MPRAFFVGRYRFKKKSEGFSRIFGEEAEFIRGWRLKANPR
jgi:hypothetical protein